MDRLGIIGDRLPLVTVDLHIPAATGTDLLDDRSYPTDEGIGIAHTMVTTLMQGFQQSGTDQFNTQYGEGGPNQYLQPERKSDNGTDDGHEATDGKTSDKEITGGQF